MREKHTFAKTINFTPTMAHNIVEASDDFDVSFAEIVRECVAKELPRLIDREKKRQRDQQGAHTK